jgi:GNAT superfamily N-acetyltransferase
VKVAVEPLNAQSADALRNGLHAFNMAAMSGASWDEFVVTVRDESGALQGGVIAQLFGDNCYIDTVFLEEPARRGGMGTQMIRMAESEARRLGARGAWLYTASFQARPFYEKIGYTRFAELKWPGSDIVRHFMKKEL